MGTHSNLREIPKPNPDLSAIELARRLLAKAEDGCVLGFMVVLIERERTVSFSVSDDIEISEAYYGLARLRKYLDALDSGNKSF